jgi:hypothetical protein
VTATHAIKLFQGDADECPRATARSTIMSSSQFGPRLLAGRFFGDMAVGGFKVSILSVVKQII